MVRVGDLDAAPSRLGCGGLREGRVGGAKRKPSLAT